MTYYIKQASYFRRRPDLSVEAFQEYWCTRHAEVVRRLPGLSRYVQNHVLPETYGEQRPVFDGVAEVWFESLDQMRANVGSDALAAIREDEANFIDAASMGTIVADEYVVKQHDGTPGIKLVAFVRRQPDLDVATFRARYRDELGPLVKEVPAILGYTQAHCRAGAYRDRREPRYDAVANLYFDSLATMAGLGEHLQAIAELERTILRMDETDAVVTKEVSII